MSARQAMLNSQRWRRLIPVAFITYSFAYLDRSNYSIGAAGGLTSRLHITPAQAGFLGGLFFLGYFVFQVPAGSFAERHSVIPEGVGPCQWGFCGGLADGWACVTRVSCFPDSCGVRGERAGGSRTGRSPAVRDGRRRRRP